MKSPISKLFIIAILSTIVLAGCEKDNNKDKEDNLSSYFEYDGNRYALTHAYIENYGKAGPGEIYNLDLSLLSKEIEVVDSNGLITSLSGTGNGLYFEIFTPNSDKIDTLNYIYTSYQINNYGTFDLGYAYIGYDFQNKTGTKQEIIEGYISVEQNYPLYEIIIECTLKNSKTLTGYYKGSIEYYNYVTFF